MFTFDGKFGILAGSGQEGSDDGEFDKARFANIKALARGSDDTIFVAEHTRIRKLSAGKVEAFVGQTTKGYKDGKGQEAQFDGITAIAVTRDGRIVVADGGNHRIRQVLPDGSVSTLAGSDSQGHADGPALSAQFSVPQGVAVDSKGSIFVADTYNYRIKVVRPKAQ